MIANISETSMYNTQKQIIMERQRIVYLHVIVFLIFSVSLGFATPMKSDSVLVAQPNGNSIWLIERGDEYYSWVETTDGYVIVQNSNGVFEYAEIINNQMVPSGIKVHNVHERTKNEVDYAVRQQRMVSNYLNNQSRIRR